MEISVFNVISFQGYAFPCPNPSHFRPQITHRRPSFQYPLSAPFQKSPRPLFLKPRAKIRLFTCVGVEKLTKKQHNFLLDKKLCFLIVPIDAIGSFYRCYSIYFPFPSTQTLQRRYIPLASGSNHSACALG